MKRIYKRDMTEKKADQDKKQAQLDYKQSIISGKSRTNWKKDIVEEASVRRTIAQLRRKRRQSDPTIRENFEKAKALAGSLLHRITDTLKDISKTRMKEKKKRTIERKDELLTDFKSRFARLRNVEEVAQSCTEEQRDYFLKIVEAKKISLENIKKRRACRKAFSVTRLRRQLRLGEQLNSRRKIARTNSLDKMSLDKQRLQNLKKNREKMMIKRMQSEEELQLIKINPETFSPGKGIMERLFDQVELSPTTRASQELKNKVAKYYTPKEEERNGSPLLDIVLEEGRRVKKMVKHNRNKSDCFAGKKSYHTARNSDIVFTSPKPCQSANRFRIKKTPVRARQSETSLEGPRIKNLCHNDFKEKISDFRTKCNRTIKSNELYLNRGKKQILRMKKKFTKMKDQGADNKGSFDMSEIFFKVRERKKFVENVAKLMIGRVFDKKRSLDYIVSKKNALDQLKRQEQAKYVETNES